VVIPVRNGDATIDACLDSVLRLDWPRERLEVVVVDNDSTDGTAAILQRHARDVRLLHEPRRGVSAARNAGIRAARGGWIAFTDADCIVEPAWLASLVAPLADPTVGLVGGRILSVEPCNRIERFGERIHDQRRAIEDFDLPYAIGMNWASPRAVLDRVGLFDEALLRCEDVDLARRIGSAGYRMVYSDGACVRHHNERTFRGLFAEGAAHGRAAAALRRRAEDGFYRSGARRSLLRLRGSLVGSLRGPDRHTSVCELVFGTGKLFGAATGRFRRPARRPIGSLAVAANPLGTRPAAAARGRERKLLLACYEPPGFGGAATAGYDLFRTLRRDGHDAVYVNLLDERDRAFFDYTFGRSLGNPDGLAGVHNVEVGGPYAVRSELSAVVAATQPDVMIGIGYLAALALRTSAPGRRLVFLTSGCRAAEQLVHSGRARDAAALLERLDPNVGTRFAAVPQERDAMLGADYVVAHSEMTRRFIERLYAGHSGKLHPLAITFGAWIQAAAACYAHLGRPFHERSIGALFIASSWDRPEKNYAGLRRIAALLPTGTIHVAGDVPAPIAGVIHHGFIADRAALFERMGDARVVVCPSLIDAAPGILHEGVALGCNLVASRNCGNHGLCHAELLAEPRTPESYAACIERALLREYAPVLDAATAGYAELVEILAAV
jgi:GT2 family glycosyltransferase